MPPTAESSVDSENVPTVAPETRAIAAVERIAASLEKLADAQSRLATVAETNSAIFEELKPYIELVPQRLLEMIENGFGARIVK